MGQLSSKLRNVEGGGLMFWCPGCKGPHLIKHGDGDGPRWGWNGDAERPTFHPSVMVTKASDVCHSFVINGNIQFLGDCTHHLAGKIVELPDWPRPQ